MLSKKKQHNSNTLANNVVSNNVEIKDFSKFQTKIEKILKDQDKWIIPQNEIEREIEIGSGAFGIVYKGKVFNSLVFILFPIKLFKILICFSFFNLFKNIFFLFLKKNESNNNIKTQNSNQKKINLPPTKKKIVEINTSCNQSIESK